MKQVFLKISGVTPKELSTLHALYEDGLQQSAEHMVFWQKSDGYNTFADSKPIVVTIVSSKFDKDHRTYTVELQVNAVVVDVCSPPDRSVWRERTAPPERNGDWELRPSGSVLKRIWDALGIFPLEEQFVKVRD